MKKWFFLPTALLLAAGSAPAAQIDVHGDLNNRFMLYTNQAQFFNGAVADVNPAVTNRLDKRDIEESWGEIKYRLWVEGSTHEGKVKGVYGIELGAIRFGNQGTSVGRSTGGGFSGDGVNIETRWAYVDIQLPGVERKARFKVGLLPYSLNSFLWTETAMGVVFDGAAGKDVGYQLAWIRGKESFNATSDDSLFEDVDALSARVDFKPVENSKLGLFALWQTSNPSQAAPAPGDPDPRRITSQTYLLKAFGNVDLDIVSLGTDGSFTLPTGFGNAFINWDLIYQTGSVDNAVFTETASGLGRTGDFDLSAWLAHVDAGATVGRTRLTYTGWYASGDDNPLDSDFEGFLATDVDRADSIILFEGGYTDDTYFTERPYLLDKGLILNKLAVDHKATEKLAVGGALLYLMAAEDVAIGGGKKSDKIGTEIDAYLSYKLFHNVEVAVNAGYLFADDAVDAFEVGVQRDGKADTDIFRSTARIRYTF